ncbi:hypothetical protein TNCT_394141 [Trichonephila clavata]|uniref:C2H2-type domain-containing protein n=1 Tax=Trichonephila clavata TaxID=2740835 RepID=A0A8X6F104_TRICU|nr:hypothetical protein TNCT_394141 [Trichonephila clavata]
MTPERSGEEPKYDCDTCQRTFQFRRHYLKHMQVHKETPFDKNSEYVAAFNSNIQCLDHLRTHEQESTLKCMYCSESLSSPDTRRVHENNHTRGNPFICEVCHKKYETKGSLQRHLLLHGSERLINSGECSGGFPHKDKTEKPFHHHKGEKQFKCIYVGNSLTTNVILKNIKRHTIMRNCIPAQFVIKNLILKNI